MGDVIFAGDLQWPLLPPCGDGAGPDDVSPTQWATAQQIAIEWLWAQSGRKFGTFDVVFRPEWTDPVARTAWGYALTAADMPLSPVEFVSRRPTTMLTLPGPVCSISEVFINDAPLASGGYTAQGDILIRTDGGTWPPFQDTTLPLTEPGTWQVTYVRGIPVPTAGQYAGGVLACDEAKRMLRDCARLPNNTTSVQRNGQTVSLDAKQLQMGYTGLREVDQWLRTVNPKNRTQDPVVWSPDLDPGRLPRIPTST